MAEKMTVAFQSQRTIINTLCALVDNPKKQRGGVLNDNIYDFIRRSTHSSELTAAVILFIILTSGYVNE